MIDWEVGQRIVCFKALDPFRGVKMPAVGDVCTIRQIAECVGGIIGVKVDEIPDQSVMVGGQVVKVAFDCRHFRPVKPTSIECFRHHLAPTPVGQLESV